MVEKLSINTLARLQIEAQTAIYEGGNSFGIIGIIGTNGVYSIPAAEEGKQLVTVTREDGVLIKVALGRHAATAGATVRMRKEGNQWIIKGNDVRGLATDSNIPSDEVQKHSHNIGNPLFYPLDPASFADGLVMPTGNELEVTIGRVTYPKTDGTIGIYEGEDVLDVSSAVTGLAAGQSRWVVFYILRSDGSAAFFSATAVTGILDYTTHIEDAVAECMTDEPDAFPYHVARIRAGTSTFGTYKAMQGRSPSGKDFVRLGVMGAMGSGGSTEWEVTLSADKTLAANKQIVLDTITVPTSITLTIESTAIMKVI
jgi:hypothetical protein